MRRMTLEVLNTALVKPWQSEMSWRSLQGTERNFRSCQSTVTLGRALVVTWKIDGLMLQEVRLKSGVHYNVIGANLTWDPMP